MKNNLIQFVEGLKAGFKDFGDCIGIIINSLLLTIIYIFGVGLTSLIAKLSKKRFLETGVSPAGSDTYWETLDLKTKSLEDYYRQF